MSLKSEQLKEWREILAAAIGAPFNEPGQPDAPIKRWFGCLLEQFRLITFQTGAYEGLEYPHLPSTSPLSLLLRSVLKDDGWVDWQPSAAGPLLLNLAARRLELGNGRASGASSTIRRGKDGSIRIPQVSD